MARKKFKPKGIIKQSPFANLDFEIDDDLSYIPSNIKNVHSPLPQGVPPPTPKKQFEFDPLEYRSTPQEQLDDIFKYREDIPDPVRHIKPTRNIGKAKAYAYGSTSYSKEAVAHMSNKRLGREVGSAQARYDRLKTGMSKRNAFLDARYRLGSGKATMADAELLVPNFNQLSKKLQTAELEKINTNRKTARGITGIDKKSYRRGLKKTASIESNFMNSSDGFIISEYNRRQAITNAYRKKHNISPKPKGAQKAALPQADGAVKGLAKFGKFGKMALGVLGLGYIVSQMSNNRGQQSNAQLYGQQRY